ncbi:MAG: L,D-transpeptidase [Sporolactobacillus sp.]
MTLWKKGGIILSAALIVLSLTACSADHRQTNKAQQESITVHKSSASASSVRPARQERLSGETVTTPVNWDAPSGGTYPALATGESVWLDVSVAKQRLYVKNGNTVVYTMVISSGLDTNPDTTTPTGTYYIQAERGMWFYSSKYQMGAEYWVSWKNHGEFLFHSVPMDKNRNVIPADAAKLGQKDSHGCIHLTVPDAKWIYDNIPLNTKVVIH